MSKFSGKCDLYDTVYDWSDERIARAKIYVGDIPLKATCQRDLIPFYPFIVGAGGFSMKDGDIMRLTTRSYVDQEEESFLLYTKNRMLRSYRRAKRKKEPITIPILMLEMSPYNSGNNAAYNTLADRIVKYGERAEYRDLHLQSADYFREQLRKEMLNNKYNEFYTDRWLNRSKNYYTERMEK